MRSWWRRRRQPKRASGVEADGLRPPLREFVYLDDVSLRSLLASQKGELTDQVTDLLSQADEAELAGSIGASSPVLKAEARSRYQTTTSEGTQTARKAVVQSLFKELRELDWIDVVLRPHTSASEAEAAGDLIASGVAVPAASLRRGALVELEVELVADPIFRFSTIASELTELARDFPEMLKEPGAREGMALLVPGNRFLQRFLAGLVPVRARSTSHVVVELESGEFVVPAVDADELDLPSRPLYVVGVTEQGSYWRDVRRVLFSGSRFIMLCRVSRDGLWNSWEPVKLADVLKEVLPEFPDLIADVGRTGLSLSPARVGVAAPRISAALEEFIDAVESAEVPGLTPEGITAARDFAQGDALALPSTATGQNEGFREVVARLQDHGCDWTGEQWLELVQATRAESGLLLFDQSTRSLSPEPETADEEGSSERLLDTEVIAIYW